MKRKRIDTELVKGERGLVFSIPYKGRHNSQTNFKVLTRLANFGVNIVRGGSSKDDTSFEKRGWCC